MYTLAAPSGTYIAKQSKCCVRACAPPSAASHNLKFEALAFFFSFRNTGLQGTTSAIKSNPLKLQTALQKSARLKISADKE